MYAITFDLDTEMLQKTHGPSYTNAYTEIRTFLEKRGFRWVQGNVYMGNETVTAVTCVLVVADLAAQNNWFRVSVKDIRQFRIEEDNDLRPALNYFRKDDSSKRDSSAQGFTLPDSGTETFGNWQVTEALG